MSDKTTSEAINWQEILGREPGNFESQMKILPFFSLGEKVRVEAEEGIFQGEISSICLFPLHPSLGKGFVWGYQIEKVSPLYFPQTSLKTSFTE